MVQDSWLHFSGQQKKYPEMKVSVHSLPFETEIRDRFHSLKSSLRSRHLRSGLFRNHPLKILAPPKLNRSHLYYPTEDKLAHDLLHPDTQIPDETGIHTIAIMPSLIIYNGFILTHLVLPEGILLTYLYPQRIHEKSTTASGRFGFREKNYLENVIQKTGEIFAEKTASLHRFYIPANSVELHEIRDMHAIDFHFSTLMQGVIQGEIA